MREGDRIAGVGTDSGDFFAARGGVLAGGDFSAGREFRLEFASEAYLDIPAVNQYATGDCQRMAREVGFSDELYFSRMFKSRFGMTPDEARQASRGTTLR